MRLADGREIVVRNIIWDVDGTLFDTYPAIARAFRRALNELDRDAPLGRIDELARESLGHCAATLAEACGVDLDRLETAFREQYARTGPGEQPPFPGAREVCEQVRAAGGQNVIVTHRGPTGTAALLSESGLAACFSDAITRADGFARKPDPAAFNAIIDRRGLRRDETLAVGDREIDVLAGRAAGVLTCAFGGLVPGVAADLALDDLTELAHRLSVDASKAGAVGRP